jgi:glyoxylase I family protein
METTAAGLDHIILTVSDYERSEAFYGGVLGFEVRALENGQRFFRAGNVYIFLIRHDATPPGDRFSEFRIGLDHLSFAAPSEQALHDLAEKLIAAGVETNGVELFEGHFPYVAFRDPDNIQLEYWYTPPRE